MREFGLIGKTLSHSFSQTYFTQKFETLGLTDCRYELFELPSITDLPALLAGRPRLRGLNVTIPYKETVWAYLDEMAPSAARVGAANVIAVDPDGRLIGHNTDYVGFRESVRRLYPGRGPGAQALVLGTGGAAKAVEVALAELEIGSFLVSRDPLSSGLTYGELTPELVAAYPLVVNATPLGTYPHVDQCPPFPYHALSPQHYLFDLVYNPSDTLFMQKGRQHGAHTHNGFEMLCLQAEEAWKIWNE